MTEPDLSAGWRPIGDITAKPADPQPEPAADKKIQRLQARAVEKRTNRHDAIETWAQKQRLVRAERRAVLAERRELRTEKRADRAQSAQRAGNLAIAAFQRILVTGPILAPMAVAWTGQSQFAIQILGWGFAASILYAAAYELTTVYWAWLYHQARTDGDSGWEYRLGTWGFAIGAAIQQWWHYSNHWHATPRAVTYSVMSAVGVLLWEGRARLIHRRKLRAEGKLPPARPRIGMVRWVRYPLRSWTAWSLTILEGHRTLDGAWTAADAALRSTRANRTVRRDAHRAERRDGVDRAGKRAASIAGPDRPVLDHADRTGRPAIEPRTAGPNQADIPASGPDRADHTQPAGPQDTGRSTSGHPNASTEDHGPAHTGPDRPDRTDKPKSTPTTADHGPHLNATGPDHTGPDLILNEVERRAIEILRSTGRSISKRSIADVVRNELGRSIASDRAADVARHFRTLRSAA